MKKKFIFCIFISSILVFSVLFITIDPVSRFVYFGDNGDRYDSTKLNNMGLIFERKTDIDDFELFRFYFYDGINILAAGPGLVTGTSGGISFAIITIRFNKTFRVTYYFYVSKKESELNQQYERFRVKPGDWVEKGDLIAEFLKFSEDSFLYFNVYESYPDYTIRHCPLDFMSQDAQVVMLEVINEYDPNMDLDYYQ